MLEDVIQPVLVTEKVAHDSDDPAVWINPDDPSKSLILGTDKNSDGALFVFGLDGRIDEEKTIRGLKRPNNVDVEYGLLLGGKPTDIAVVTERLTHKLRIYSLPDMVAIDGGGIPAFEGEVGDGYRDLMGIALYKDASGAIYAFVGRKNGPSDGTYIWQYRLEDDGVGKVKGTCVRKLGNYSGKNEIEAIAVDDALGYVYYSDEGVGVRKYYADPTKGNEELALFGTRDFSKDHEGISIYESSPTKGYILVSDQGSNQFHIFTREGTRDNPHDHQLVRIVKVSAQSSDGSEVIATPVNNNFPRGMFVAMSNDKTFHLYSWDDIIEGDLHTMHTPAESRRR